MQTAPVTARTFASPWSITPSATVPIVATVRSPERIPTKPSSPFPPKTSSASAEMLASATRLRLRVESVRATPRRPERRDERDALEKGENAVGPIAVGCDRDKDEGDDDQQQHEPVAVARPDAGDAGTGTPGLRQFRHLTGPINEVE